MSTAASSARADVTAGERTARWWQQWRDIMHVDKFPTEHWRECGLILAFLTFTEFTVIEPMRKQQQLREVQRQKIHNAILAHVPLKSREQWPREQY